MTEPSLREVVMTFSAMAALISRICLGEKKITMHIECRDDQAEEITRSMLSMDFNRTPPAENRESQIMGITVTWGPKV